MSTEKEVIRVPIVAGVVIKKDGRYLFVQEKQPSAYGLWNFPAGRVDVGETIEEAAIREAKEESGYDIELIRKIDIFQENAQEPAKHAFEARIIGGDLNFPKDELLDARWFDLDEIQAMKDNLRGEWILKSISLLET
jgi:8-oxo-dGTP diphosphatase